MINIIIFCFFYLIRDTKFPLGGLNKIPSVYLRFDVAKLIGGIRENKEIASTTYFVKQLIINTLSKPHLYRFQYRRN